MCNITCVAQEIIIIHLKEEKNRPIPFFTIQNVKYKDNKYFADSLGKTIIPYIKGMASQIHAIGFQDTIITLQQHHDLSYILGASNNL